MIKHMRKLMQGILRSHAPQVWMDTCGDLWVTDTVSVQHGHIVVETNLIYIINNRPPPGWTLLGDL